MLNFYNYLSIQVHSMRIWVRKEPGHRGRPPEEPNSFFVLFKVHLSYLLLLLRCKSYFLKYREKVVTVKLIKLYNPSSTKKQASKRPPRLFEFECRFLLKWRIVNRRMSPPWAVLQVPAVVAAAAAVAAQQPRVLSGARTSGVGSSRRSTGGCRQC